MKNKMFLLITASIIALVALSLVQVALVNNTFRLKKELFYEETIKEIGNIENAYLVDSVHDSWFNNLEPQLVDYKNNRITNEVLMSRVKMDAASKNEAFKMAFKQELSRLNLDYEISYKRKLISLIIFDGEKKDTLYKADADNQFKLFGEDFPEEESVPVNVSRQFVEYEYVSQTDSTISIEQFNLEIRTKNVIRIKNGSRIVFSRMYVLLTASILIFLFVIGLFYYSIKNLISQKKITVVKTDFINNITHELKTPLATLNIASKSLKSPIIKNDAFAFENTLEIVDRQNDRLQKLIDQVLTNSLGSNELVLSKNQIIDTVYFNDLIADFKLSVQHESLEIINEIYPDDVLLRIDTFHFTTAILNILENAVKYSNEAVRILIKTKVKNNFYHIEITDNGIGIKSSEIANIFDKFYRVNAGDLHEVKGLGLGMYYTSQIIKAHKGYISATSELKKGSTFTIKIPLN